MDNNNNDNGIRPPPRIRPPTGTRVSQQQHASEGIGKAYPKEMREMVITRYINGLPDISNEIIQLRHQHKWPSISTCQRWIRQYNTIHNVRPKRRSGNKRAQREIRGRTLRHLALYRTIRPKATIAEVQAVLHTLEPNAMIYSPSQVFRGEDSLGLSRVAGSTTTDNAYLVPINIQKRHMYWNNPYPLGMIKGIYNRAGQKLNVLLAICGDNNDPMRFSHLWTGEGTTLLIYYNFMRSIIDELERRHPGRSFCFTKDNLNVHKNPIIMDLISNAGHRVVFRAPYYAVDGAIEYVFNTLQTNLMVEYNNLHSLDDLRNTVNLIIGAILTFRPYFEHVGFN